MPVKMKPPEFVAPTASASTRERNSPVARRNNIIHGLARQAPRSGYDFLRVELDHFSQASKPLAEALDEPHRRGRGGRPGYPAVAMLRLHLLQFVLRERYANRFLRMVTTNPRFLELCGLAEAPTESTYSRFKRALVPHRKPVNQMIGGVMARCNPEIERLKESGIIPADAPRLGEIIAFDATDVVAYANPKRKPSADQEARWGYRTPKNNSQGKGDKELFYGYKVHAGNDAYYGLPLYAAVAPANLNEGPRLRSDLDAMLKLHPDLKPRYLLADKGYHALYNFQHAVEKGITPIIDIPRPPRDKATKQRLYDGIYAADGRPTCVGQQPMDYLGTDTDGAHWFRCPPGGCHLKDKLDWSRYCNDTHWENPTGKLIKTMGIIPRFSSAWKELYQKRSSIERYFSSAKQSRLLNRHQCLGQAKVELHVNMATLAYALTALAHLEADDYENMGVMDIELPGVKRTVEPSSVENCQAAA